MGRERDRVWIDAGVDDEPSEQGLLDVFVFAEPPADDGDVEFIRARVAAEERESLQAKVKRLREALEWYGEQARLARLIHSEGDAGRNALASDGGKRARKALALTAPDTGDGWRSMDSAPRDGTEILAFGHDIYPGDDSPTIYFKLIEYDDSGGDDFPWSSDEGWHRENAFSHWRPLPEPPTDTEGA